MRLTLEPWSPEYDTSFHAEESKSQITTRPEDINLTVELEPWGPVQARRFEVDFTKIFFVDGRRRLEGKVWAEVGGAASLEAGSSPGLLGTFAVGAVQSRAEALTPAAIVERRIERVLILAHPDGEDLIIKAKGHEYGDLRYTDRKSTRLNSSHSTLSRMPSSA